MKPAKTTAEKYQMHGETVTLSSITERMQEGVEHIKSKDMSVVRRFFKWVIRLLNSIFRIAGRIIKYFFLLVRYIVGFALTLGGILALVSFTMISTFSFFMTDFPFGGPFANSLTEGISSSAVGIVLICAVILTVLITIIVILIAGVSLLTNRNRFNSSLVLILSMGWIVAFSVAVSTSVVLIPTIENNAEEIKEAIQAHEYIRYNIEVKNLSN